MIKGEYPKSIFKIALCVLLVILFLLLFFLLFLTFREEHFDGIIWKSVCGCDRVAGIPG